MMLISQTMATYDEMQFRAICQRTLGMKEGRVAAGRAVLRKKEEAEVKGKRGDFKEMTVRVYGQLENKRACVQQMRRGFVYFSLQ